LQPPVLFPVFLAGIRNQRLGFGFADGGNARRIYALLHQIIFAGIGATLTDDDIILMAAKIAGMTFDGDFPVGILLQ
jgi:hypothetical protein